MLLLMCLAVPPPAPAQQGNDDLWEVTVKMEMAGMPFAMPPQTSRVCTQKGKQSEAMAPQDKECRMVDMRQSGNRTSFKVVCEGKNRMTGTGDFVHGVDSYQGTMRMQGVMEGQQIDMTQTMSGRRVGGCTWEDPSIRVRQMQKQADDQKAQMCRSMIDKMELSPFVGPAQVCQEFAGEFRTRVGQVAGEMRTAVGFDRWLRAQPNMQQVLQYGGQDPNAVWSAACTDAGTTRNWKFLATYCEAQARQIALQQCTGRDYTAIMEGPYGALCQWHARTSTQPPASQGASAPATGRRPAGPATMPPPGPAQATPPYPPQVPATGVPPSPAQAAPQPPSSTAAPQPAPQPPPASGTDKLKEGLGKMRGILGF
jgi:hypothetical protein